jgi:superoxide reductase
MDRRTFLKTAAISSIATGITASVASAERFFPVKVDQSLFTDINRVKDPAKKTPLEKTHGPVISAPASVKAGESFAVEISIGENLHAMGPSHWIEYIELAIGNEPVGRADMQARGFMKPRVTFLVALPKDVAPSGKVALVAHHRCNLHGYWESSIDISVV